MIRPLWRVGGDAPHQLVAQLLVRAIVENGDGKRHRELLQVERVDQVVLPSIANVNVRNLNEHERRIVARVHGYELQFDARLGRQTDISFGSQLLQARFKDFPTATCTNFSVAIGLPYLPATCTVCVCPFASRTTR